MNFNCIWLSCHETHGDTIGIPNALSTKYNLTNICLVSSYFSQIRLMIILKKKKKKKTHDMLVLISLKLKF